MPAKPQKPTRISETRRCRYNRLWAQLDDDFVTFKPHYSLLSQYFLPTRLRFETNQGNRGDRKNQSIIDPTGTRAAAICRAGMTSGIQSPARPWFRLTTEDPDLAEFGRVKEWLYFVTQVLYSTFSKSNYYKSSPLVFGDITTFATSAMLIEPDEKDILRTYVFPVGSYRLANDENLNVRVFMREFRMTVRQIVQKFGQLDPATGTAVWDNISTFVRDNWDRGNYEKWVNVRQIIAPNDNYDRDAGQLNAKYKRYMSCYYETGSSQNYSGDYLRGKDAQDIFLRETGYDYFPVLAPRWEVTGEDVYGTMCPGMESVGHVKALQVMARRKAEAIEKFVRPPMKGGAHLKSQKISILPGDMTFDDAREGRGFQPVYEIDPRIQEMILDIQDVRQGVMSAHYADLFLMMANTDRREITATEIDERKEEKLIALGPVYQQVDGDFLSPSIDINFDLNLARGKIPEPPEELQGMPLKVEYISVMAQAQKMIGIAGHERFIQYVGQLASLSGDPSVWDKVDKDQSVDIYADWLSVHPNLVRPDDKVVPIRQARNKAVQAQQNAASISEGARAARDLSGADVSGDNALKRLMETAQAGALVQ